ncbi:demethoxyubiquinone hydroxylase family protein [Sphingomonas psychrotolerans]|uniref:Demethoxyubiquinone hydroxylase family protein n=1 Tax=Sphingomonas psychrotolerans TaxID=1327635 RepID=A0A2K8MBG4_9SPHN|nr:demethoxyubiquinone hydroxylase family protein [Sphingomonas psychrotolerans]ATY31225.1 demethoxyubiquinone hydroxylase family protein [Sphingomonas psychrotolerans]
MALLARLKEGETLGDRVMKVDHAGEHGAICVYRAQRWFARWRAPEMVAELDTFLAHERGHRAQFGAELQHRNRRRCRSYFLCAIGGFVLGTVTGLAGRQAIAATTVAIEQVVLRHMNEQVRALDGIDQQAVATLRRIIGEEQEHHDLSVARLTPGGVWPRLITPLVSFSTEAVIWLGMRL